MLLYEEALGGERGRMQQWEGRNIWDIVNTAVNNGELTGWQLYATNRNYSAYGRQRGWFRLDAA